MIDVENDIFNRLYDDVAPICAKNCFRIVSTPAPTAFPAVTLFEMDNKTDTTMNSNTLDDDYAILTYETHVYAQTKQKARAVFAELDRLLQRLNMSRLSGDFSPNNANTKVFEYVARYRVKVDQNGVLYRVR